MQSISDVFVNIGEAIFYAWALIREGIVLLFTFGGYVPSILGSCIIITIIIGIIRLILGAGNA